MFVGFCGELRGLAPVSELGLRAGQQPAASFKFGQACALRSCVCNDVQKIELCLAKTLCTAQLSSSPEVAVRMGAPDAT